MDRVSGGDASGGAPQGNYSTKFLEKRKRNWVGASMSRTNQGAEREGRVSDAGGEWRWEFVARGFVCENLKSLRRRG